jgi:CheY-like chemotaxis protein
MADGTVSDGLDILIVDDNQAAAQTTGWLVEAMGHRFHMAFDGVSALAFVRDRVPDVVLMDIGLPGMNGFDLCTRMRAMTSLSDTVFIAQTGYGDAPSRVRASQVGCKHFLLKPFDFTALQGILDRIAQSRQRAE